MNSILHISKTGQFNTPYSKYRLARVEALAKVGLIQSWTLTNINTGTIPSTDLESDSVSTTTTTTTKNTSSFKFKSKSKYRISGHVLDINRLDNINTGVIKSNSRLRFVSGLNFKGLSFGSRSRNLTNRKNTRSRDSIRSLVVPGALVLLFSTDRGRLTQDACIKEGVGGKLARRVILD